MKRIFLSVLVGCILSSFTTREVRAQSPRSFGNSLQPQASSGGGLFGGQTSASTPGAAAPAVSSSIATPSARFLRQNRNSSSQVGKNPANSGKFIGSIQTDGRFTRPAAADAVERPTPSALINPPRTPLVKNRMYEPKISVGFNPIVRPEFDINASLQRQVNFLTQKTPTAQVTTIVSGETVHLVGQVGSEQERALIEQMMLFEPGIAVVQNDLQVTGVVP